MLTNLMPVIPFSSFWKRFGVLLSLAVLSHAAAAVCAQIEGSPPSGEVAQQIRQLNLQDASALESTPFVADKTILRQVYARLVPVAKMAPGLAVCTHEIGLNAIAFGEGKGGLVVFGGPLLSMMGGDPEQIAAVMAHEFAHLLLGHLGQRKAAQTGLVKEATKVARKKLEQSGSMEEAIATAKAKYLTDSASFSREVEREADDKGFSLAVTLAHFSGEGFKRVALGLSKFPADKRPAYLDSHPSWSERLNKASALTDNQSFSEAAQRLFAQGDWKGLSVLVDAWLQKIPASGAAWYYKGRVLAHAARDQRQASLAFEESASRFVDNKVLGTRSQEDQIEYDEVWYFLCRALFDEGYRLESANCSRRIHSDTVRDRLLSETFGGLVIIAGEEPSAGSLQVGRKADGSKLLTNTPNDPKAVKPIAPVWRPIRYPD